MQLTLQMKKKFQFEDLKLRLTYLMQQVQEKALNEYMAKLEDLRKDIITAEDSYNKVNKNIEELKEKILAQKENKEFEKAIKNCESLIQLAKSIEKSKEIEKYSQFLIQFKEDLKYEELKAFVLKYNKEGLDLLKKGEFLDSLKLYEKIRNSLKEWI